MVSVTTVVIPAFGWHHWRISVKLSRHMVQITAKLDRKLNVQVEVDDAKSVKISPVAPDQTPTDSQ